MEAWIAAPLLSVNRPHPLECHPLFPYDSPPLSCPLPTPASMHIGSVGAKDVLPEGPVLALV